jgi:hypothetical protein
MSVRSINLSFPDDDSVKDMILFKRNGTFPSYLIDKADPLNTNRRINRYEIKAQKYTLSADKHSLMVGERMVILPSKRDELLSLVYNDTTLGSGKGITSLYKLIQMHYLNISRSDVTGFLKRQPVYQLTKPIVHKMNKPQISLYNQECWQSDLIDMSSYANYNHQGRRVYNWISTTIDLFSGRVWLRALPNKTPESVIESFENIYQTCVPPVHLQVDNGGKLIRLSYTIFFINLIFFVLLFRRIPLRSVFRLV